MAVPNALLTGGFSDLSLAEASSANEILERSFTTRTTLSSRVFSSTQLPENLNSQSARINSQELIALSGGETQDVIQQKVQEALAPVSANAEQVIRDNLSIYREVQSVSGADRSTAASEVRDADTKSSSQTSGLVGPAAPVDPDFIGPVDERTGSETQDLLKESKEFSIKYSEVNGSSKYFNFSLLPAIESTLRSASQGQSVPEVKPGILLHSKMNLKKLNVPGAASVYQSLGIDQIILQMTGLFIGAEGLGAPMVPDSLIYGEQGTVNSRAYGFDALKSSNKFMNEVVYSGAPVEIFIRSQDRGKQPILFEYRCLIQGFRTFSTRHDRVYYAIDAVVLSGAPKRLASTILQNNGVRPETTAPDPTSATPGAVNNSPSPASTAQPSASSAAGTQLTAEEKSAIVQVILDRKLSLQGEVAKLGMDEDKDPRTISSTEMRALAERLKIDY